MNICFLKQENVNSTERGKITYSRCPIYSMTIPGTEFSPGCLQGTALSPKRDQREYSFTNESRWSEPQFRANAVPSRFSPETSAQTTLLRQQSFLLNGLIFLSIMPFHQRRPTLSLLPLRHSLQVSVCSLEIPFPFPVPS